MLPPPRSDVVAGLSYGRHARQSASAVTRTATVATVVVKQGRARRSGHDVEVVQEVALEQQSLTTMMMMTAIVIKER